MSVRAEMPSQFDPSFRRFAFAGMQRPALGTFARLGAAVEGIIDFGKSRDDALWTVKRDFLAMDASFAIEAIPFEPFFHSGLARSLDDNSDGAFLRPLRRMADVGRQHEYFALANRNIINPALVGDLQDHVARLLKKPFFDRIVSFSIAPSMFFAMPTP